MTNKTRAWLTWLGLAIVGSLMGVAYGAPTLLYETILENTGCTPTQFGFIFSAMGIGLLIGSLLVGKAIEINSKAFSMAGSLCALILYAAIGLSNSIFVIIVAGFLYGLIFQFCGNSLLSAMCARWFNIGRGKVVSIAFVLQALASVILNPILAKLVVAIGGKAAALLLGIVFSGVSFFLLAFAVSRFPEHYNMKAIDLGKNMKEEKISEEKEAEGYECSLPVLKIIMTPAFLLLAVSVFLMSMGSNIYFSNSTMIFQSFGLDYESAALAMSIYGIAGMAISFLSGVIIDKLGPKKGLSIFFGLAAAVCLACPLLKGWTGAVIFAVFIPCCSVWNMIAAMALPKMFGVKRSASLMGYINFCGSLCSIIIGPIATGLYGRTGSYVTPVVITGAGIAIATVFVWISLGDKMAAGVRRRDEMFQIRKNAN